MSCNLKSLTLAETVSGETWDGLTLTIDSSDDTKFADTLALVRMTWTDSTGAGVLTLSSATSAITVNAATAYAWSFTIEPRALSIPAGVYSWAVETTDGAGVVDKDFIAGTQTIITDPHA
jgi:hypothetical protein